MTIDERIKLEEKAIKDMQFKEEALDGLPGYMVTKEDYEECRKSANEHQELINWLKELKVHRAAWMKVVSEVDQHTDIHSDGELYIKNFDVKKIVAEYKPKDGDTKLEQQPCDNAISSKDVRDTIWRECSCEALDIDFAKVLCLQRAIKALPPVTPQPKMGRWEWVQYDSNHPSVGNWKCSECHSIGRSYFDYCPACGAKMQEVEK